MCEDLEPERVSRLIADSLAGKLSPEDAEELRCWAERSPQNRQLLESLGDVGTAREQVRLVRSHDVQSGWQKVERCYRRRRLGRVVLPLTGMAAVVALLVGVYLPAIKPVDQPVEVIAQTLDVSAVRLVRASGEVIAVDTTRTIDLHDAVVESDGRAMTIVAREDAKPKPIAYSEVTVPESKRFDVTLADGTHVTLNACSKLRFPEQFPKEGAREVYLTGEAFFEVEKDAAHPFIVHAGDGYVRVTGTEFNMCCYEDTPSLVTTLIEGRVLVGTETAKAEVALTPGMQAVQDRQSGAMTTAQVDVSEFTAWRQGLFAFREKPLKEILKAVARWYGCRVKYENPTRGDLCFTGKISQASSLAEVAGFFTKTGEVLVSEDHGMLVIR